MKVGTCVWARDSQRVGCGASKEPVILLSTTLFFAIYYLGITRWGRRRRSLPSSVRRVHPRKRRQAPRGSVMALFALAASSGYGTFGFFPFRNSLHIYFHFLATHQVHIALPHPTDCRKFYTCLDGITPRDQGCPARKVFNPTTSSCDDPTNVVGCETYYNKPEPRRPPAPPPVSQVGLTSYIKS